jgi:hypothetical protein
MPLRQARIPVPAIRRDGGNSGDARARAGFSTA